MIKIIINIFYKPVSELKKILSDNCAVYVPVNGGAFLKDDEWCRNNCFFDDDFNGNISALNNRLNEMTSIWWAWKNLDRIGNPEYIGFNHYRRFFDLAEFMVCLDSDIYVAQPIKCGLPLLEQYRIYHNFGDLLICRDIMNNISHNTGDNFMTYLSNKHDNFAPMNMFVMRRKLFEEWCGFIFPILFKLVDKIDVSGRDNYQKRAVCFLCERIFGWWCFEKSKTLKVQQIPIIEHLDFKDNKLNERGTY